MNARRVWIVVLVAVDAVSLTSCGPKTPALGTEENPILMSFVPSGDTQEIIARGEQIAQMSTDKTGLVVKVPLFIEEGEHIRVDTRTGEFVSRA